MENLVKQLQQRKTIKYFHLKQSIECVFLSLRSWHGLNKRKFELNERKKKSGKIWSQQKNEAVEESRVMQFARTHPRCTVILRCRIYTIWSNFPRQQHVNLICDGCAWNCHRWKLVGIVSVFVFWNVRNWICRLSERVYNQCEMFYFHFVLLLLVFFCCCSLFQFVVDLVCLWWTDKTWLARFNICVWLQRSVGSYLIWSVETTNRFFFIRTGIGDFFYCYCCCCCCCQLNSLVYFYCICIGALWIDLILCARFQAICLRIEWIETV